MVASLSLLVSGSCKSCTTCNEVDCSLALHLLQSSAGNLSKQFGPSSGIQKNVTDLRTKLFDTDGIPEMIFFNP